jgi:hypothetical protein
MDQGAQTTPRVDAHDVEWVRCHLRLAVALQAAELTQRNGPERGQEGEVRAREAARQAQ